MAWKASFRIYDSFGRWSVNEILKASRIPWNVLIYESAEYLDILVFDIHQAHFLLWLFQNWDNIITIDFVQAIENSEDCVNYQDCIDYHMNLIMEMDQPRFSPGPSEDF